MYGSSAIASRPIVSAPRLPRPYRAAPSSGEFGFAAWSFSRQAKLNAWAWHGLGESDGVLGWATLGNYTYLRREAEGFIFALLPDTWHTAEETSADSDSVEASTQWLDFGKPGQMKALTGIDCDVKNVTDIEVYISVDGGRTGELAASFPVGDNNAGWTYNGELIPCEEVGAATEFKLRFIGDANQEVQINRLTLYWDAVQG
jgi:hypothetical protein